MEFQYIDIHAHVNSSEFDNDRDEVITRSLDESVYVVNVGTDIESSKQAVLIAEKYEEGVYAIVGIHPHEVMNLEKGGLIESTLAELKEIARNPKVIGIGECGLDFFKMEEYNKDVLNEAGEVDVKKIKSVQERVFRGQIDISLELDKPLMLHSRESYGKTLGILYEYTTLPSVRLRGDAHFFAGSLEQALAFISYGFTISFTGVITFAKNYEEIIKGIPLNKILSETDCPYVAPIPFRGKRAEPVHVKLVVQKIAEIKGISTEEAREQIEKNVKEMFFS
ncbi:MAG: TatD family hydrolase [bacterium]